MKMRQVLSVTLIQESGLSAFLHFAVPKKQSSFPVAPTKMELESAANKLLDAFTVPWTDQESTASTVRELADGLEDRPPPLSNIGQVKSILKHLNPRKATGADGVPAWLLKRFYEELAPVIHEILCASTMQCKYPSCYKHALVSPISKVDNPVDLGTDFRQISVLSQVSKVLERIQLKLNQADLKMDASQHAFMSGRSTVTALTSITQDWYNVTDQGSSYSGVHALFVDFREAFDLVDHRILLTKLVSMGVSRSSWLWCQSFLINRTQQVKLPGVLSRKEQCQQKYPRVVLFHLLYSMFILVTYKTIFLVKFQLPCVNMLMTVANMNSYLIVQIVKYRNPIPIIKWN